MSSGSISATRDDFDWVCLIVASRGHPDFTTITETSVPVESNCFLMQYAICSGGDLLIEITIKIKKNVDSVFQGHGAALNNE
jgi:hypothetical protein